MFYTLDHVPFFLSIFLHNWRVLLAQWFLFRDWKENLASWAVGKIIKRGSTEESSLSDRWILYSKAAKSSKFQTITRWQQFCAHTVCQCVPKYAYAYISIPIQTHIHNIPLPLYYVYFWQLYYIIFKKPKLYWWQRPKAFFFIYLFCCHSVFIQMSLVGSRFLVLWYDIWN